MHTITLSNQIFTQLEREAQRAHLSPSELAERLLANQLTSTSEEWVMAFEALLRRVHRQMAQIESPAIEADITLAAEEVKAEQ